MRVKDHGLKIGDLVRVDGDSGDGGCVATIIWAGEIYVRVHDGVDDWTVMACRCQLESEFIKLNQPL